MKKVIVLSLAPCLLMSSCGTILGGKITDCQKSKPVSGGRQVRVAALIGDIFLGFAPLNLIVDFADGGMYKPCDAKK